MRQDIHIGTKTIAPLSDYTENNTYDNFSAFFLGILWFAEVRIWYFSELHLLALPESKNINLLIILSLSNC